MGPESRCQLKLTHVAVGVDDVHVAGVEGRDGDGPPPVDEVLGILAHLSWCQDVAGLLANLVEAVA